MFFLSKLNLKMKKNPFYCLLNRNVYNLVLIELYHRMQRKFYLGKLVMVLMFFLLDTSWDYSRISLFNYIFTYSTLSMILAMCSLREYPHLFYIPSSLPPLPPFGSSLPPTNIKLQTSPPPTEKFKFQVAFLVHIFHCCAACHLGPRGTV